MFQIIIFSVLDMSDFPFLGDLLGFTERRRSVDPLSGIGMELNSSGKMEKVLELFAPSKFAEAQDSLRQGFLP